MSTPEPAGSDPPGTEGGGTGVDIRYLWSLLEPETRQWLMDHAGTALVPRTVTAALCRAAEQPVPQDAHGQARLSEEDLQFIRSRAHSAYAAHGTARLFDTVQPPHPHHNPPGQDTTDHPPRT